MVGRDKPSVNEIMQMMSCDVIESMATFQRTTEYTLSETTLHTLKTPAMLNAYQPRRLADAAMLIMWIYGAPMTILLDSMVSGLFLTNEVPFTVGLTVLASQCWAFVLLVSPYVLQLLVRYSRSRRLLACSCRALDGQPPSDRWPNARWETALHR